MANHELGHALVALALPSADRVHKVSIIPRGIGALGYTLQRPSQDRHVQRRAELVDRLTVLMAGRAAEQLVFGEPSTGAADDLVKATDLARDMVMRYGMDARLGPVAWARDRPSFLGELPAPAMAEGTGARTSQHIDQAVRDLVGQAMERAWVWLRQHRQVLDRGVELLLQHETLDEAALVELSRDTSPMRAPATTMSASLEAVDGAVGEAVDGAVDRTVDRAVDSTADHAATAPEPAACVETLHKTPAVAA